MKAVNVNSEIGVLKTVVLHRPGAELENLTPDTLTDLLFDDIPYLKVAQEEHDFFAQTLRDRGAEILYYDQLATEALAEEVVREQFVGEVLKESNKHVDNYIRGALRDYLLSMDTATMVRKIIAGVRRGEVNVPTGGNMSFEEMVEDTSYPFHLNPQPNCYFSRDYAAGMGNGMTINRMHFPARRRESLFMEYIVKYHPRFANADVPVWYHRDSHWSIEGGDEQIWSPETVAVGLSQRSEAGAIERLAQHLIGYSSFKRVIALDIPKSHALMHLDTVLTMVDRNKFTIFPGIMDRVGKMDIFILTKNDSGQITIEHRTDLLSVLKDVTGYDDVQLLPTGGGDRIAAEREQWNDGSNTLTIAPGVVVTYDRNYVSNQLLRDNGLEVLEIPGAELGRGRGGPRCMSMPIWREDI